MILRNIANCCLNFGFRFKCGPSGRSKCDLSKLRKEGFEYKYGLKEILSDSVECAKRLGAM